MRQVTIDELFTWGEDFGLKARSAFGGHHCDCSSQTYADLKLKCDAVERKEDLLFDRVRLSPPFNGVSIHVRAGASWQTMMTTPSSKRRKLSRASSMQEAAFNWERMDNFRDSVRTGNCGCCNWAA